MVSSPPPTKMFPLGGFPLGTPREGFPERHGLFARGRRSHSAIPGSKPACGYPRRIAACHGLRRRPSRAIHRTAYVLSVDYGRSLRSSSHTALTVAPNTRWGPSRPSSGSLRLRDCIYQRKARFARREKTACPQPDLKEVIRPQVPLRPPCYDFSPLGCPRLDPPPPKGQGASPGTPSGGATGGVCKEQGRIHRALVTRGY